LQKSTNRQYEVKASGLLGSDIKTPSQTFDHAHTVWVCWFDR